MVLPGTCYKLLYLIGVSFSYRLICIAFANIKTPFDNEPLSTCTAALQFVTHVSNLKTPKQVQVQVQVQVEITK